jgi:hypothetical protein
MRTDHLYRLPLGILIVLRVAACAPAQNVSLDDVRSDVAKEDYRSAAQKLDKLLFPSMPELTPAQRYELLMLKGECQLQLKDRIGASSAFKSAAKYAGDVKELAAARANMLIIDRSTLGKFIPRFGTGAEPIEILPMDARKRAMMAFEAELASQYKSQIDAALEATKLPPIEQVFTHAADMYALELFATGQASQTSKVMEQLGGHAYDLLRSESSRLSARVDYLGQLANSSSDIRRGWNGGRLGLTSQQRDEVKRMIPYLNQLRERASEYRGIAARLGGNEAKWDALVAQTVDALADAQSLYNDR